MSGEPDNLVLELLRALRGDIAQVRADTTAMRRTLSEHSHKLSALTGQVAQLRSAGGGDAAMAAITSGRVDTIEDRLALIEERIGLTQP